MATSVGPNNQLLTEPDAHVIARRWSFVLRSLLIVACVATIVLFLFYRPAAYLAAIPIPVLIVVSAWVKELERRSRATALRKEGQTHISKEELETDVSAAGIATAVKVLLILAFGTFIVAAALFDLQTIGIAATALFLLAILIEIPYLALFVTESERDEIEKVRSQTHSPTATTSEKPAK